MIKLMVGNNWDLKLLDNLSELNNKYQAEDIKIVEVYGSVIDNPIGTARPTFRLQDKSRKEIEEFTKVANAYYIELNYTLNIPCFGNLDDLYIKYNSVSSFLKWLENIGIKRVTVTHPLLMDIITKETKLEIELSTIFHITSIRQLALLMKQYRIRKVCMNLMKNRDFKFLSAFQNKDVDIELMVNEMCNYECIYRASCYNLHAHTVRSNRDRFSDYPMGYCTGLRDGDLVEWLKARFILPQWLEYYSTNFNINHFKVTGRTGTTKYITWVVEQYMKKQYDDNLIALWFQLENIGQVENKHIVAKNQIPADKIKLDFLEHFKHAKCDIECNNTCAFCNIYLQKIQENNGK